MGHVGVDFGAGVALSRHRAGRSAEKAGVGDAVGAERMGHELGPSRRRLPALLRQRGCFWDAGRDGAGEMILKRSIRSDDAGDGPEKTREKRDMIERPPNHRLKPTVGPVTGLARAARPAPCPPAA